MRNLLKKFLKNSDGAVALETVLIAPIMIFGTVGAIDIALKVKSLQDMSNTTRNGIEFVSQGSRDADNIRAVMSEFFGKTLSADQVSVNGYCACVSISETPKGEDEETAAEQPKSFYVKTAEDLSENMCSVTNCSEDSTISTLIEIEFDHTLTGIMDEYELSQKLQTRVR